MAPSNIKSTEITRLIVGQASKESYCKQVAENPRTTDDNVSSIANVGADDDGFFKKYSSGAALQCGIYNSALEKNPQDISVPVPKDGFRFGQLGRDKKLILIVCVMSHFVNGLSISLLAPFFPQEALRQGMSITMIGVTFSLFPFVGFLLSPLFGSLVTKVGPKFTAVSGLFVGGVCNILYGTLSHCPAGFLFIVCSLVCRSVEAVAYSAYVAAVWVIVANEFPKRVSTAFAFTHTACEVGLMIGPGIGGFLYELGGFGTPFYAAGSVIALNALFLYVVIPELDIRPATERKSNKIRSLLKNRLVVATLVSQGVISTGLSFLESTLANHLQPLDLSTSLIGLIFTIVPLICTISCPIVGYLTDSKGLQEYFVVFGQLGFGIGFYLIGPGSFFPFLPLDIRIIIPGLVLVGACFSSCCIPLFKCVILGAREEGWEESADTYGIATGLLNSMFFLGSLTGPLLGGFLVEREGYRFSFTATGTLHIAAFLMTMILYGSRHIGGKGNLSMN